MKKQLLATIIGLNAAALTASASAATPSMEEMWELIQQQQAEIQTLKAELGKNTQQIKETQTRVTATADAVESVSSVSTKLASWVERTSIGGYGEHHFNHIEDDNDQIDAHRYVLYFAHQFTDDLRFFSEFELEHSLAGDGKPGEVELEQAFIEWDFADNHRVQIGQFLIPVGILNETHEPDTFYGTERNNVEKEIIPATWWETGVMVTGEIAPGLSYNAAIHSGLEVPNSFRIRSGRQKSAEANAEDLAFTGRLKYTGIPGLELAATIQHQQDITQGSTTFSESAEATLFETHLAYQGDRFGLRALYANWDIDGDDAETAEADSLDGWYVEPSFKITPKLGIFARYSEFERGDKSDTDYDTWDYGINYWLHPRVVLKADYSDSVGDAESDAFNLGVGWSF
ncbi:MAG: porin [Pseudomonadales bacterium]|nr:porin [Pseudomonadales bacterium]MCP5171860.1 porin [Pseudomonadales bacterium]